MSEVLQIIDAIILLACFVMVVSIIRLHIQYNKAMDVFWKIHESGIKARNDRLAKETKHE